MSKRKGNYLFDLDRTLAEYTHYVGPSHIGEPIKPVLDVLKELLAKGCDCRIFTARASHEGEELEVAVKAIEEWCLKHVGQKLPVTCKKDYDTVMIFDDRAVAVEPNTGKMFAFQQSEKSR